MKPYFLNFLVAFFLSQSLFAQNDLLNQLEENATKDVTYSQSIFASTRLVNGHTTKMRHQKVLDFLISHRFGTITTGLQDFYGLDQASIRLALEYGLTDYINLGLGRSSFEKTYDAFAKVRVFQPKWTGPLPTVVLFGSVAYNSQENNNPNFELPDEARFSYVGQILISSRVAQFLSLQISPTWVRRNLVTNIEDENDVLALGTAASIHVTKTLSINLEYFHQFNPDEVSNNFNSMAIGVDLETGGHVFQLHFTNAQAMIEKGFITETTDDFFEGDWRFGFNISRVFQLGKKKGKDW